MSSIEILLTEECWIVQEDMKSIIKRENIFQIGPDKYSIGEILATIPETNIEYVTEKSDLTIQDIAKKIFYCIRDNLNKRPTKYVVSAWEGKCPYQTHKRKKTALLTRKAKEKAILKFKKSIQNQHDFVKRIERAHKEKNYEFLADLLNTPKGRIHFQWHTPEKNQEDIYCGIRKINKKKAKSIIYIKDYDRMEAEFLHRYEKYLRIPENAKP